MTKKDKHSSGPKTGKSKAVSSRNSLTHGLTARRWLDANEQSLFDETVEAFNADFDPKTSIEKVLIVKMAEYTVRLMRIQQTENAMFNLASSEAEHPNGVIKSLDNGNTDSKLVETMRAAYLNKPQFNPAAIIDKTNLIYEIDFQSLGDISGWKSETSAMRYLQSWNDSNWLIIN